MPKIVDNNFSAPLTIAEKKLYLEAVADMQNELKEDCGCFCTISDVAKHLGVVWRTASNYLEDVPSVTIGKRKKWRSLDVARKMARERIEAARC